MEERERDERVEGVGEELLPGEREVGGLREIGAHGCARAVSCSGMEKHGVEEEDRQESRRGSRRRRRCRRGECFLFLSRNTRGT
jgi:hypothetical protein